MRFNNALELPPDDAFLENGRLHCRREYLSHKACSDLSPDRSKVCRANCPSRIPPGVINVLPGKGSDAGQAVADHELVRKLGFTGSTPIGKHIMKSCADSNLKKCSLELGGKSPLIIFADCDMDKAVKHVSEDL